MRLSRRQVLATTGAVALAATRPARADNFPSRPLRLVVGYTPGAATDFAARVMADAMTTRLGQTVVVENRPGAGSMIAVDYVAKSPRDGTTLMFANEDATSMLAAEKPDIPYKIPGDFSYISRVAEFGYALVVSTKMPFTTMAEMVAYAKAHPNTLKYGSSGVGGASHVAGLILMQQAGFQMSHVPYRGAAQALTDIVAGFISMGFMTMATVGDQASSGKIRVIAVTSSVREKLLPDVPTMIEAGFPGATFDDWFGILGPAGLPPDVLEKLRKSVVDSLSDPDVQKKLGSVDLRPSPLAGAPFAKLAADEYTQWKAVAQANHIVIE